MVLEELPAPLTLLFSGFIIGAGYLALASFAKESFGKMRDFDKFMYSLIFGMLSFLIVISIFNININIADNNSVINFLKGSPVLFVINVFISRILLDIWEYMYNKL